MYHAAGAAMEKLIFHECLPIEEAAKRLETRYSSKEQNMQNLAFANDGREKGFLLYWTPYFVGANRISQAYANGIAVIEAKFKKGTPEFNACRGALLRNMYTGFRSSSTVCAHVDHFVRHAKLDKIAK